MPKEQSSTNTTLKLPGDFRGVVKALVKTPPPPAGDPSTRKQKPKKKPAKKAKRR
jgi:hypothetical protein